MKLRNSIALAIGLLFVTPSPAKTLTFGVDVSEQNPIVELEQAAKSAGEIARAEILAMQLGDTVRVRRFGERRASMPSDVVRLTRANRPARVAATVEHYLAALPSSTPEGDNQTNILAFFELGSFDCTSGERIVLFTDGVEASKTLGEKAFLSGKALPKPKTAFLKGCEVVMIGVGQSVDGRFSPELSKSIRARWTDYFKAAGATFTAITDQ